MGIGLEIFNAQGQVDLSPDWRVARIAGVKKIKGHFSFSVNMAGGAATFALFITSVSGSKIPNTPSDLYYGGSNISGYCPKEALVLYGVY